MVFNQMITGVFYIAISDITLSVITASCVNWSCERLSRSPKNVCINKKFSWQKQFSREGTKKKRKLFEEEQLKYSNLLDRYNAHSVKNVPSHIMSSELESLKQRIIELEAENAKIPELRKKLAEIPELRKKLAEVEARNVEIKARNA
ncbi:hypothetical protein RclHR1_03960009 [Rhizophagus clarus]|uniref:Uncharacterized protein n=1 Tax=Rhizophagus clarus TaxID=94130 RepID=A0A2Z6RR84_9GLOM|nr:hypothetical protein RclHR1_03960009 [Rhizophagus clarus]